MNTEDTNVTTDDEVVDMTQAPGDIVKAQVVAAGCSYFTREPVRGATGQVRTAPNGEEIYTESRQTALFGQTVEMTRYEFDRLHADGIVREPSDAPLRPEFPPATPFGMPMKDEKGILKAYEGPVMGDPNPQGGLSDLELAERAGGLTPEQAAEFERASRLAAGENEADSFDIDEAAEDEIAAKVATLSVPETLALAKGDDGKYDEARALLVLTAELEREAPRVSVTEPLEKATE